MSRTDLFFQVKVEHDPAENPERIGDEIRRHVLKLCEDGFPKETRKSQLGLATRRVQNTATGCILA
jgi:hypothetical protein